jgi:alkanesulfonate monooxygenase SsuD/methylene tetrahydromethanopterin reductase-like flavin-dependent oxidoreductase (luciferase family)
MKLDRVSLGIPGTTPHDAIRMLAPRIESAGFHALWLNDTAAVSGGEGDSLAGLAVAAEVTTTLVLATGVIALDRRTPTEIAVAAAHLPQHRLVLGIGSGGSPKSVTRVSDGLTELRALTTAPIYLGALGPRMRRLAATRADGVLFNWLTPAAAGEAMGDLQRDATGRTVRAALYARTALTPEGMPELVAEARRYGTYPAYAANFARIGADPLDTTIDGSVPGALAGRAAEYLARVDELVLRAITGATSVDSYLHFIDRVTEA